jgi:CHRD domain
MPRVYTSIRGRARAQTRGATRALLTLLAITLLLALAAGPVRAQSFTFTAVLNSGQEPETPDSKALGVAFVTFNTATGELCFRITFEDFNLTSEETAAHFHAPAPPGVNAAIIIPVPLGNPKNGCVTPELTDDLRRDLFRGLWYFNIHTKEHPGGEIRGQLIPQAAPVF